MGYEHVRHYSGGLADWMEAHEPVEQEAIGAPVIVRAAVRGKKDLGARVIDYVSERSIGSLLMLWLKMIAAFGVVYWLWGAVPEHGLKAGPTSVAMTLDGLATSIYFSFVTALSIGYGDVTPTGFMRVLAVVEGAAGLIIFGCVISKLVSRRQEELIDEIHRITFEDRLGRVRTNLHLVLSDLQDIAGSCEDPNARPERVLTRMESVATVFTGELQAIHDLLYRPQLVPDEDVLESILASLAACMKSLVELVGCSPVAPSAGLRANLRLTTALATEICGECVPRDYAPALKEWMDRIQSLARSLTP
ncbi:MAG: ion channel [Acidobacteriota bacterium]